MRDIDNTKRRFYRVDSSSYRFRPGRLHPVHGRRPAHRVPGTKHPRPGRRVCPERPSQRLTRLIRRRYCHDHPNRYPVRHRRPDPRHAGRPAEPRPHLNRRPIADKNKARRARLPRLFLCVLVIQQHVEQDVAVVEKLPRHLDVFGVFVSDTLQPILGDLPDIGVGIADNKL